MVSPSNENLRKIRNEPSVSTNYDDFAKFNLENTKTPPSMLEILHQATGKIPYPETSEPLAFGNLWLPHKISANIFSSSKGSVLQELSMKIQEEEEKSILEQDENAAKASDFTRRKQNNFFF